jgi:hypothetical protein
MTTPQPEWIQKIQVFCEKFPKTPRSDWENTNHYEITDPDGDAYFWLTLPDVFTNPGIYYPDTEEGKRVGLLMDLACQVPALLEHCLKLREALEGIKPFAEACQLHEHNGKYPGKAVYGFNGVNLTFDALNSVLEALLSKPEGKS